MAALDEESGVAQRVRELCFDSQSFGAGDALQMQHRPREHLQTAPEHTAGRANSRLVLIEALRRGVATNTDINAVRAAVAIGEIEQHQIEVVAAAARCALVQRQFIKRRQRLEVAHR